MSNRSTVAVDWPPSTSGGLYITDSGEYEQLGSIGWNQEGTAFYGVAA